ncbi:hypothetical protein D4R51_03730 [bacterium]|nr:MAG: hypothetical protein D4R51_03730 [bacterium]
METNGQNTATIVNPLKARTLSAIETWREWRIEWDSAARAEMLHSLLHFGFSVRTQTYEETFERICFYLDIADGHGNERNFGDEESLRGPANFEELGSLSACRLKKVISKKAFHILCDKFFKDRVDQRDSNYPSWAHAVARRNVLSKLLWFFRWDEESVVSKMKVCNLDDFESDKENNHHYQTAREFAFELCKFVYTFQYFGKYAGESDKQIERMFKAKRPAIIRLLLALKKGDALLSDGFFAGEMEIAELERICLAEEFYDEHDRRTSKSVKEACFRGSSAAKIAILLRVREEQRKHFEMISELKRKKESAEEGLRTLQSSSKT